MTKCRKTRKIGKQQRNEKNQTGNQKTRNLNETFEKQTKSALSKMEVSHRRKTLPTKITN